MGRITSHILWKIIQMFETTSQYSNVEIDGILQITMKLIGIY